MGTILLIILILLLIGALPVYPHSQAWGPGPTYLISVILIVLLVLLLLGYVPGDFERKLQWYGNVWRWC